MASPIGNREDIYGYQTLFREIGYYISRLELYENSLKFFDEALALTPNDKRALIGRSRTRAKACEYAGAIEDINKALNLDADDLVVLADKALNTYLSCEFEEGLVQNTRLIPIRQKPDHFAMGVMHCSNAIENCVAQRAGRPLRDHFRVIRRLAWKKNYEAQKPFEPKPRKKVKESRKKSAYDQLLQEPISPVIAKKTVKVAHTVLEGEDDLSVEENLSIKDSMHSRVADENIVPPYVQPFLFKPLQNYTTNIENYMAEKYLDSMYLDKVFLKKLQTEPGSTCPNVKGSSKIRDLARIGYKTVAYKQELLRTRRPFYYIKYQEATSTGALKLRQEQELKAQQQSTKKEADVLVMKMLDAFKEKKIRNLLDLVEKLKIYCDSKSKRLLIDKDTYLEEIYTIVRRGFYELNRLNKDQYVWDQEKRIYMAFGLPISREPSQDSVIQEFKNVFVDYKRCVRTFERRLKSAVSSEEMCWCYHELSRYLLELKRYELARVYGRKCIQEGRICNLQWVINGIILLTRVNIQQHNKNDARNEITAGVKVAQELQDPGLEEYLVKCLSVIEKIEFDDAQGPKVLEMREKNIVAMMASAKMKDEVTHLFRMMSVMPSSRRMLVMPGVRIEDIEKTSRSRKASIMPAAAVKQERVEESTTTVTKKTHKEKKAKGLGFMELIQYHVD